MTIQALEHGGTRPSGAGGGGGGARLLDQVFHLADAECAAGCSLSRGIGTGAAVRVAARRRAGRGLDGPDRNHGCFPNLDVILGQLELLQSYQVPGLRRWEESFTSTFLFQIHPFITGAALFSAYAAFKQRDARYAIILWLPLLLVLLEIKRIRYLLPVFPMLALMASYGLREIATGKSGNTVVLCIVASSMVLMVFGFLPFAQKASAANLKQAGEYLDSLQAARGGGHRPAAAPCPRQSGRLGADTGSVHFQAPGLSPRCGGRARRGGAA